MILFALDRLQIKIDGNTLGLYPKEIINIVIKDLSNDVHHKSIYNIEKPETTSTLNKKDE